MPSPQRLPQPQPDERAHSDRLLALIRSEIDAHGPMPFARYMERCLYTPGLGYYSAGSVKFGAGGDFITAPELGPLFAQCVVHALAPVLRALGAQADFLELGAGSGAFASHALRALAAADSLPCRYLILEPSADLRQRQRDHLRATLPVELHARIHWLDQPPSTAWQGVLFANEVIDALPATRFAIHAEDVFEEYVTLDANGQLQRLNQAATSATVEAVRHIEDALGARLAEGYRSEWLPQLPAWLRAVVGNLHAGAALFIDYGYARRDYYRAEHSDGTLMAHYRHRAHADPFWLPGLNDLTVSVDFSALAEAGHACGMHLAVYLSQAEFLFGCGLATAFEQAYADNEDAIARHRLAHEVKQLTMPERMGERFQAMLLTRGDGVPALLPPSLTGTHRQDEL